MTVTLKAFTILTGEAEVFSLREKVYLAYHKPTDVFSMFREETTTTTEPSVQRAVFEYRGHHDENGRPIYEFIGLD